MTMEKPICILTGQDGNVFNVVGLVSRTLKRAGQADKAREFVDRAMKSKSYDDVLALCWDYVEVE
jgi:hypothetical protein